MVIARRIPMVAFNFYLYKLVLFFVIFSSLFFLVFFRVLFLEFVIFLEVIFLAIFVIFCIFSWEINDYAMQVFCLLMLGVFAAETGINLTLVVVIFNYETIVKYYPEAIELAFSIKRF